MTDYKIVREGIDNVHCANCNRGLNLNCSVKNDFKEFGKVFCRCSHCEYHSKVSRISNRVFVRLA